MGKTFSETDQWNKIKYPESNTNSQMDLMYMIRGNSKWWAKIDYTRNKWVLKQLGSHLQKMLSHISQEMFKIKFQCIIAVYIKR